MLFHFRHQVAQLDQELVRVTALQVVFDLLLTFGLEAFKVNTSVPELEHVEPSTNGSEQEKSDNEDDGNEEGEDDDEKRDDDDDVEFSSGFFPGEKYPVKSHPAATVTTFVLDFRILSISLARSWYFSYFSVSFYSTLLSPETLCPLYAFFFSELLCLASCGGIHGLFG